MLEEDEDNEDVDDDGVVDEELGLACLWGMVDCMEGSLLCEETVLLSLLCDENDLLEEPEAEWLLDPKGDGFACGVAVAIFWVDLLGVVSAYRLLLFFTF